MGRVTLTDGAYAIVADEWYIQLPTCFGTDLIRLVGLKADDAMGKVTLTDGAYVIVADEWYIQLPTCFGPDLIMDVQLRHTDTSCKHIV